MLLAHRGRSRRTASRYAARRLGFDAFILGQAGGPGTTAFPPASRVSISELLGERRSPRLRGRICPLHCREDPFVERLVEDTVASADLKDDFLVPPEATALGKSE